MWNTFDTVRTVLVVARSLTSTIRLLEATALFRGDDRVQFRYTINDTTEFSDGVQELLAAARVGDVVPWRDVPHFAYDLALSASENIDFDSLRTHAVVLPHGLGFNKFVPDGRGGQRLAGLPPVGVLARGCATVVLSHPEQAVQLAAHCPESTGTTAVTGDVTFGRLQSSAHLRERYRERFGTADRTLVLVASTWGGESALGSRSRLVRDLLDALPVDGYQVAVCLHPNVWAWHGARQVRLTLGPELAAGAVLLPAETGWHSAMIASDVVVTDHGSLGLFAAGLGKPLLLTGGASEVVPGTPVADLARSTPLLDPEFDQHAQIDQVCRHHDAAAGVAVAARVFGDVSDPASAVRDLVYERLGLDAPTEPAPLLRIPDPPTLPGQTPVSTAVIAAWRTSSHLLLTRYPAATWSARHGVDHYLVVDESEEDIRLRERAAVLLRGDTRTLAAAVSWATRALATHPGARVAAAATPDGVAVRVRGSGSFMVITDADSAVAASAAYACLFDGPLITRDFEVVIGRRRHRLTITPTGA